MYWDAGKLQCSPSDLTVFLDSEFASWMDRWHLGQQKLKSDGGNNSEAHGSPGPFAHLSGCTCSYDEKDEGLALIARKGTEHEQAFLQKLKTDGFELAHIASSPDAFHETLAAMKRGVPIIYQASLRIDGWRGYAGRLRHCFDNGKHNPL